MPHGSDNHTLEIIKRCLVIDEAAHLAYTQLGEQTEVQALSQFWLAMAEEESTHVCFWKTIVQNASEGAVLPSVFESPDEVLAELDEILPKVKQIDRGNLGGLSVEDAFLLAYRLEFYMLHPAFELLYHLLRVLVEEPCPEDEYENHIDRFVDALSQHGRTTPALELLGETLRRLWRENKKLAERATRDSLTGCLTRQAFNEVVRHLAFLSSRKGESVGMMMIDLDHFKSINDEKGHHTGDMVLVYAAKVIQESVRKSDVVARYGGEEFIVFMPGIELPRAKSVAERVRKAFSELDVSGLRPTLSAGVTVRELGEDIDLCLQEILATADENLYRAKQEGRNRVV